jgi:hypothetical protein
MNKQPAAADTYTDTDVLENTTKAGEGKMQTIAAQDQANLLQQLQDENRELERQLQLKCIDAPLKASPRPAPLPPADRLSRSHAVVNAV